LDKGLATATGYTPSEEEREEGREEKRGEKKGEVAYIPYSSS